MSASFIISRGFPAAFQFLVMRRSGSKVKKWQKMVSANVIRVLFFIMSEVVFQPKCDQQLAGQHAESENEGRFKFQLIQRGDFIKPGWWHWRCRREDGGVDVAYGYVQADSLGRAVVPETFEKD